MYSFILQENKKSPKFISPKRFSLVSREEMKIPSNFWNKRNCQWIYVEKCKTGIEKLYIEAILKGSIGK